MVLNWPPPRSSMSFPSITDASESKKKLQCASSRPSSAFERAPVRSRNRHVGQPAMADLLPEHAQRVVLAEELRRRDPPGTCPASPSRPATAACRRSRSSGMMSKMSWPMPRTSFVIVQLVGKGVADERLIGPQQDLVEVVGMRRVELLRDREGVDGVRLREALDDRAAARPGPGRQVDERDVGRVAGRNARRWSRRC